MHNPQGKQESWSIRAFSSTSIAQTGHTSLHSPHPSAVFPDHADPPAELLAQPVGQRIECTDGTEKIAVSSPPVGKKTKADAAGPDLSGRHCEGRRPCPPGKMRRPGTAERLRNYSRNSRGFRGPGQEAGKRRPGIRTAPVMRVHCSKRILRALGISLLPSSEMPPIGQI